MYVFFLFFLIIYVVYSFIVFKLQRVIWELRIDRIVFPWLKSFRFLKILLIIVISLLILIMFDYVWIFFFWICSYFMNFIYFLIPFPSYDKCLEINLLLNNWWGEKYMEDEIKIKPQEINTNENISKDNLDLIKGVVLGVVIICIIIVLIFYLI